MKIQHSFGKISVEKNADEDAAFMLTNRNGSYAFMRQSPSSRYEGIFLFDDMRMYRLIENISILGSNSLKKIKNSFYCIEREWGNAAEKFFFPGNFSSLIYELNAEKEIDIFLDCKDSYDNREFGRYYDIFEEDNCIVARFTKRTDNREDLTSGMEQYVLYLAIKFQGLNYKKIEKWEKRDYAFDEKRNSKPYSRYVLHALRAKGKNFVFSMAKEKGKALEEADYILKNLDAIKENEKKSFNEAFLANKKINKIIESKKISSEVKLAYVSAINSLGSLSVNSENLGILAGLPWFYQFWSRDEAISLKALGSINRHLSKKIILRSLDEIQGDGRLPKLYCADDKTTNADAIGWLFSRAFDFYGNAKSNIGILEQLKKSILSIKSRKIRNEKIIALINRIEKALKSKEMENSCLLSKKEIGIRQSIDGMEKNYAKDGLIFNNSKETWMDTAFNSDGRSGFNIEMQALMLMMYKNAFEITKDAKYKNSENILKKNVLEKFRDGSILADNLSGKAIRPNVFIAHYIYPQLLQNKEWEKCFENALKALWLDFGGISTIDRKSPLFTPAHTGEYEKSYHNGDSWFWINSMAAISLLKINKNKFKSNIAKILSASTQEILWKGVIGAHSELSSAEKLTSEGCLNQAWSNAMFVELIHEVFG